MTKPVSEMVERVARQLYCAQEGIDLATNSAHLDYWFGTDCEAEGNVSIGPEYRRMAIAAIKAMREVSEPMRHIGGRIVANLSSGRAIDPYEDDAVNAYQAMIDAALGDTNAA